MGGGGEEEEEREEMRRGKRRRRLYLTRTPSTKHCQAGVGHLWDHVWGGGARHKGGTRVGGVIRGWKGFGRLGWALVRREVKGFGVGAYGGRNKTKPHIYHQRLL